jgi:hypothetical protein
VDAPATHTNTVCPGVTTALRAQVIELSPASRALLARILSDLSEADKICDDCGDGCDPAQKKMLEVLIERAFENSLYLMETIGKPQTRSGIVEMHSRARTNLSKTDRSVGMGGLYSVWSYELGRILYAVQEDATWPTKNG